MCSELEEKISNARDNKLELKRAEQQAKLIKSADVEDASDDAPKKRGRKAAVHVE